MVYDMGIETILVFQNSFFKFTDQIVASWDAGTKLMLTD